MKSKFCLIRTDAPLDEKAFVYVIWVGSTDNDFIKLGLVEAFCKDCGWYFKKWSATVDSALEKRTKYARLDGNKTATPYQFISLSISECYQAIVDDSFSSIEKRHVMTPQEKFMRFRNDPLFLLSYHHKKCITMCPPSTSKTFCRRKGHAFYDLPMSLGFIVLLFILDAIVSRIIGW